MRKKRSWILIIVLMIVITALIVSLIRCSSYKIKNEVQVVEKETVVLGRVENMKVTCYSLVEFVSDGITASGKEVKYGMVASNQLPFGTRVRIEGFGGKIFVVEDRFMTGWTAANLDIYFGDDLDAYKKCVEWGKRDLEVLILQDDDSIFVN